MRDRYDPADSYEAQYPGLDELITEYVDGTMDPVLQESFEAFLASNPRLAEHVYRIKSTRAMLCGLGCACAAPPGFNLRLRCRLAHETDPATLSAFAVRPRRLTATAVALVFLLVAGGVYNLALAPVPPGSDSMVLMGVSAGAEVGLLRSRPRAVHHVEASMFGWAGSHAVPALAPMRYEARAAGPAHFVDTLRPARLPLLAEQP